MTTAPASIETDTGFGSIPHLELESFCRFKTDVQYFDDQVLELLRYVMLTQSTLDIFFLGDTNVTLAVRISMMPMMQPVDLIDQGSPSFTVNPHSPFYSITNFPPPSINAIHDRLEFLDLFVLSP